MKKFLAILCALALCLMCATAMAEGESHPKYVFMFIGDGMGNPQVTATQYYLGSIENPDSKFPVPADLSFTKFPSLGLVTPTTALPSARIPLRPLRRWLPARRRSPALSIMMKR